MKKFALFVLAAALVFSGACVTAYAAGPFASDQPAVGQPAPSFSLPSQDGTPISLDSLKGKWVVLYFYPKDMTQGCTIEAHGFQRDLEKYDAAGAVIVGVSVDTVDSHKQFCAKDSLTFHLLADPDHKVVDSYGSFGLKIPQRDDVIPVAQRNTFLIDPQGKIAKVWIKVDPSHHSEEVLAAINELKK